MLGYLELNQHQGHVVERFLCGTDVFMSPPTPLSLHLAGLVINYFLHFCPTSFEKIKNNTCIKK